MVSNDIGIYTSVLALVDSRKSIDTKYYPKLLYIIDWLAIAIMVESRSSDNIADIILYQLLHIEILSSDTK